ncbi:hypothetical protein FGB62_55g130 [Gracilaria domingensis]|nr:hypothetical protein FGB62_55g130 [Gracilaria domingensis]
MSRGQSGLNDDAVNIISNERRRLQRHAQQLNDRVTRWSDTNEYNGSRQHQKACESELENIVHSLRRLRRNATLLFDASEQILVPTVKLSFSEQEQLRFNSTVLKNISGKQARISLVVFTDAVDLKQPVVADSEDAQNFERDVPGAIRRLGVPFWRKRFVGDRIRFLTEE